MAPEGLLRSSPRSAAPRAGLDWITNANHDYAASRKTIRQYSSRKVNRLEKNINFESNYVTLLIDRG